MTNTTNVFRSNAICVQFAARKPTFKIIDRAAASALHKVKHAEESAGTYHKALVDPTLLKKINAAETEARKFHHVQSAKWSGKLNILPLPNLELYSEGFAKLKVKYNVCVDEFCDPYINNYVEMIAAEKVRLGDLFDESVYPDPATIRARFGIRSIKSKVPNDPTDFRLEITSKAMDDLRAEMVADHDADMKEMRNDFFSRIIGAERKNGEYTPGLLKIVNDLRKYKAPTKDVKAEQIFRDSLIEKVREIVVQVEVLNITDDLQVQSVLDTVKRELLTTDAQTLRENPDLRNATADKAQQILDQISEFCA